MFRFIPLLVLIQTQCEFIESSALLERYRREDNPVDTMKTMAVIGIGMAKDTMTDAFEQGVSAQKSANVNVFGQKVGYDTGFRVGGDKGGSTDDDSRRRKRRSLFYQILDDSGVKDLVNQRHRRQLYSNDESPKRTSENQLNVEDVANNFMRKMREVWMEVLQRVRNLFEEVSNKVQARNE